MCDLLDTSQSNIQNRFFNSLGQFELIELNWFVVHRNPATLRSSDFNANFAICNLLRPYLDVLFCFVDWNVYRLLSSKVISLLMTLS